MRIICKLYTNYRQIIQILCVYVFFSFIVLFTLLIVFFQLLICSKLIWLMLSICLQIESASISMMWVGHRLCKSFCLLCYIITWCLTLVNLSLQLVNALTGCRTTSWHLVMDLRLTCGQTQSASICLKYKSNQRNHLHHTQDAYIYIYIHIYTYICL